ncbi:hypothetical protein EJV44_11330 [Ancylobacter aquaticus]|nr:hypothetical protein EJV44_11330 [Ancylobacter aquaticus]
MNRRAVFTGGSALALLALPSPASAACALPAPEHPADKASRLAWELADAMNAYEGGCFHAVVHPSAGSPHPIAFLRPVRWQSPEERIEGALATIKTALAEKYPDHFITGHTSLRVSTGGVVAGAYPLEDYEARMHFHSGPMLPADAGRWRAT